MTPGRPPAGGRRRLPPMSEQTPSADAPLDRQGDVHELGFLDLDRFQKTAEWLKHHSPGNFKELAEHLGLGRVTDPHVRLKSMRWLDRLEHSVGGKALI